MAKKKRRVSKAKASQPTVPHAVWLAQGKHFHREVQNNDAPGGNVGAHLSQRGLYG